MQTLSNGSTLKLIIWGDGSDLATTPNQLFNLAQDPEETRNLVSDAAGRAEHKAEVSALEQRIRTQVSTRILGGRTAPFPPLLIPHRVPHGFTPRS